MVESSRLKEIIGEFPRVRMGVVGDLAADLYLYGRPHQLSREAPVVVIKHEGEQVLPGGAANVACNLAALGSRAGAFGFVGSDSEGTQLKEEMGRRGISVENVLTEQDARTFTKIRVFAGDQHVSRQQIVAIDKEPEGPVADDLAADLARRLEQALESLDGLVISDYRERTLHPVVTEVLRNSSGRKAVILADSRRRLGQFTGVTVSKPNEGEAEALCGFEIEDEESLRRAGRRLLARTRSEMVLLTRGNQGMVLFQAGSESVSIPIVGPSEVTDVTGAGDTVAAAMTLALAAGGTPEECMHLANHAAAIVVAKRGVATVSPEELIASIEEYGVPNG